MTIRSMPTNKNWYDNYDLAFGKKEEPVVLDLPPMYFFKAGEEWHSVICGEEFNPPLLTNIYRVDQTHYKGMLMFEMHIMVDAQGSVQCEYDLAELREALDFCSNYGGFRHG